MKKIIITLAIVLLCMICIIVYMVYQNNQNLQIMREANKDYESFYGKETYGTNVMSLINKAIDDNQKNVVAKDEKGNYIENDTNSIIITVQFKGQEDEIFEYRMEQIAKQGSEAFIKNFGAISFKCINIDYHEKTNIVKSMYFEQL